MTVQEAIKQLKAIRSDYDDDMQRFPELVMQDVEALDMAIEALKGKDTNVPSSCSAFPNRSDVISRQDAIYYVKQATIGETDVMKAWVKAQTHLMRLPSAQPEIIRCKDCKYSSPNMVYGCRLERYSYHDDSVRMYSEDFCSKAERREDERFNQQTGCG